MILGRSSAPRPKYTVVGETLRYVIPSHMQCSIGCGGRACKYEDPSRWSEDNQAIKGLYSSWITDDLLAMARPSTEIIEKYKIIEQFQRCGVKTVINLQHPGEHASCGNDLEQESGFTYRPEAFMEAGIYFYNYGWNDYGVASLTTILDMVKVMSFAVKEGKIAVHCHAGLGRTGVLLACYLVYTTTMTANEAILFVRAGRPNSIQTRGQLMCVRQFSQFLVPLRTVFSCTEPKASAITLSQYLNRQQHLLHGYEARRLKHMPKIVQLVCRLLVDIAENRQVVQEDILDVPDADELERARYPQAMYRRDREMIGRGVGGPLPRLPGPATVPLRTMEPALFYARRSLSYSDSDLSRLNTLLNLSENPQGDAANEPYASALKRQCLSQNSLRDSFDGSFRNGRGSIHSYTSSVWEQRRLVNDRSPVSHTRRLLRDLQRSRSLGSPGQMERGDGLSGRGGGKSSPKKGREEKNREDEEEDQTSEVPFIMIQTELTLEARRLLVAQALAVDLEQDGKEEHKQRVSSLQRELNSGVGCWENLCTERDPFVLSGLMWSWLEQLREPVITRKDVQALEKKLLEPTIVLNTLDKGPQQTLTCILDCAAQVMTTPEDVQSAFLNRTIKAFTKMKAGETEEEKTVYKTMREILASVLNEMRMKFLEEPETTDPFLYSSLPSSPQCTAHREKLPECN